MSNNPPPNIIWLQWDGEAETPEPCTDDPDDRNVTWCRERVFNRDIQFERSDRITELKRELSQERQDRKQADLDTIRALGERNTARRERDTALRDLANERAYLDRVASKMNVALNDWNDYLHTNETPVYQQARDELTTISKFRKSTCVCGFCDGTDCN